MYQTGTRLININKFFPLLYKKFSGKCKVQMRDSFFLQYQ